MNRCPDTTQNLLRINPRALADENLEPMQKHQYKRQIVLKRCVQLRIVGKNKDLRKKRKEPQMQKFLPLGLPLLAVEASRLKLPLQMVNLEVEVKACRLKLHNPKINLLQFTKEVQGAGDQTKFQGSGNHGAAQARILPIRPIGRILISVGWCDSSEQEELELTGSRCASSMYDGGMPQLRSCAGSWNELESQMRD